MTRPWSWRWLVLQDDLPPMPARTEVITGCLTRRSAQHEADMLRIALNRSIAQGLTRVRVRRANA